jgi:hypothetical protein
MRIPVLAGAMRGIASRLLCALALLAVGSAWGDQVEMSNGDRYVGKVVSMAGDTLVLQSEVLGTLRLRRSQIATILLGPQRPAIASSTNLARFALTAPRSKFGLGTNHLEASSVAAANATNDFSALVQQLGADTNTMRQVQDQFLAGAGPQAQAKFNDLLGGLLSGKVDLAGLRAEAKSTLEQAQKMRGDMGDDGGTLDSYLSILDSFLKETDPQAAATNSPPPASSASTLPQTPGQAQ